MDENSEKGGLFNRVRDSFKSGTRPGFLGGDGGGEAPSGSKAEKRNNERASANGAAADSLKDAEDNASGGWYRGGDNLDEARQNEQEGGSIGFYRGGGDKVGRAASAAKDIKKGNFKGAVKKVGPFAAIFLVIFIVGGVMAGTQVFELFSVVANLQEDHNSMHTSVVARTSRWVKWQLGTVKDPVKGRLFGSESFKISEKQSAELAKHGIEYDKDKNVLRYSHSNGEEVEVDAKNFDEIYKTDIDFAQKYNAGSMNWRGQFANWYGNTTNTWLKNNNLTRNMTKDFKNKVAESDGDGGKVMRDMLNERTNTVDFGSDGGGKTKRENLNQNVVQEKLGRVAAKFKGGDIFDIATNSSCAFVEIMGAFSGLVYAAQALQIMNIATLTFETVDKTKAGYGDEAPINELANMFNEKASNTNAILSSESGGSVENVKLKTDYTTTTKSAMESEGIASLFSGKRANPNDPSLKSFNLTGSINSVMGGIGGNMDTFRGCSFAKVGTAVVSGIATGAGIATCIAGILMGGVGAIPTCGPLIIGAIISIGASAALAIGIDMLVAAIAPMITSMLVRDLTGIGGEDFGNANWLASNLYQGGVGRSNGLAYASVGSYKNFAVAQQQVIAEDARNERMALSPFDITSKNTFMGSMLTRLSSLMNRNSITSIMVGGESAVLNSLVALAPSASATASQIANDLPTEEEYEEYCPYLASVGGIGDSGCVPYSDSDFSTMDDEPGEVIDVLDSLGAFSGETSDGNVKINKDSDFAKYVRYCPGRNSMLGTPDLNIKAELTDGTSTGNTAIDGAIGAAPLIGEGITILEETEVQRNLGYIDGESCVDKSGGSVALAYDGEGGINLAANVGGTVAKGDNWNVARYYQRFIEDQSLAESMGIIEKSAVEAYLEEYYEENPLDESYEGQLARWSGLDKETVSDMLDVIAYYNYIDAYDASERYAFGAPVVDESEKVLDLENEYVMDGVTVALEGVVYADVRNRNFVA